MIMVSNLLPSPWCGQATTSTVMVVWAAEVATATTGSHWSSLMSTPGSCASTRRAWALGTASIRAAAFLSAV